MNKILFVYDHKYPTLWRDGLREALILLESDFSITYLNLSKRDEFLPDRYDLILGWGAFNSKVDHFIRDVLYTKRGLLIGGNASPPYKTHDYDVLFYETDWYKPQIEAHKNIHKAFGINSKIYFNTRHPKVIDYITVGSFSAWKRQNKLLLKRGIKLAIGEIQEDNLAESIPIVNKLLAGGVIISGMMSPANLAHFYNISRTCYIPADVNGGGERAVLEARACGLKVEIEGDNPKLQELVSVNSIPTENDYYKALKKGITSIL